MENCHKEIVGKEIWEPVTYQEGRFMNEPLEAQIPRRWRRCGLRKSVCTMKIIFPHAKEEVEAGTYIRIHHKIMCDNPNIPPHIDIRRAYVLQ